MSRKCPTCGTSFADSTFFCGHDGTITVQEQSADDFDARLGQRLGQYVVVARVADGAMGRVYEGRHSETKARTAIKVLHDHVARDHVSVERFKREYETANELSHPHIVKVLEFGSTPDGSRFLTMEYLEGEELGLVLKRDGKQPLGRVIRLGAQAAQALDFAHSFGVIHRDLKPDNIFLCRTDKGDSVRLLDFGSVKLQMETGPKLTALGTTLGSPYYMSPEQAMGQQDVDPRTDVFALGAILFECLTGKIAFDGSSVAEILMKIVTGNPPAPSSANPALPRGVDAVILRALQKDKRQRPGTSTELVQQLGSSLGLSGNVEQWGATTADEITSQLGAGSRAPASVAGPAAHAPSAAPVMHAQAAPRVPSSFPPPDSAVLPGKGVGLGLVVGLVVMVVVVGGVAVWLLR